MKTMPNDKRGAPTKVLSENKGETIQEPITLEDAQKHIQQLQNVSVVAAKLFALIREHVSAVSSAAPLQRGRKTV